MNRIILVYGIIAGAVGISAMTVSATLGSGTEAMSLFIGYVILLAACSLIFVAVKRYRDRELGGVIRFGTALGLGLGVALVASIVYVLGWEAYLWSTDYGFFPKYVEMKLESMRSAGASAADISSAAREMRGMAQLYDKLGWRLLFTFAEIMPVGLVVAFISAALLRNSRFLPARDRSTA